MSWAPLPLETDENAVTARILDGLVAAIPGYVPSEGSLDTALAEEIGREIAATNARTATAAAVAVAGIGTTVFGVQPITGARATLPVTITVNAAGAQIPAGFQVIGLTASGVRVAFSLPIVVTSTGTTVAATLQALEVGSGYNAVPPGALQVITSTIGVIDVSATDTSSGGVDEESLTEYLSRFVARVAILHPGGVRGTDVAVLARDTPGVQRALAIDLYDATTSMSNVARTVSVFPVDGTGQPVGTPVKAALLAALDAVREVNFVFRVADPHYTTLAITFTAVARTGYDPDVVEANITAAVLGYLSPARWGGSADGLDDDGHASDWTDAPVVRYLDLARVAGSADGVAYLSALTINGGTGNVTLTGPAALPSAASTCTGTVTA